MPFYARREDGQYLMGQDAMTCIPEAVAPFETFEGARTAIHRYRIICAVHAPERRDDAFSIIADHRSEV